MAKTAKDSIDADACPCGGGSYANCCGRFHHGVLPGTAEQLMRARYSAYVLGLLQFVHDTWHPRTRVALSDLRHDPMLKWLGLEVKCHVPMGDDATVEFIARSKAGGRAQRLHEVSRFVREGGQWFYVDGSFPEDKKQ
jgi:SEC-C motif-containing protein